MALIGIGGRGDTLGANSIKGSGGGNGGTGEDATDDEDAEPNETKAKTVAHDVGAVLDFHGGTSSTTD